MAVNDDNSSRPAGPDDPSEWPVVSPNDIGVAELDSDLAYMGLYLKLEIRNNSSYLVREAELRIDGKGPGIPGRVTPRGVATTREIKVGPLFPGVYAHEEIGIGAQGGITGVSFDFVTARAVKLTPPGQMVPASEYPGLVAEIIGVAVNRDVPDLRKPDDDGAGQPPVATVVRIRVRNSGATTVERVRLKLQYFDDGAGDAGGSSGPRRDLVAEWVLDMPRREWNPYQLPEPPDAVCDPADPLRPGQSYEFTLVHYNGGPHDWSGRLDATAVEVVELKLRS